MDNQELQGTLVLVHPWLENDPQQQQGNVGIITYIDDENDIYVSFKDKAEGRYPPDALLQLKERADLFPGLMNDAATLSVGDFKDLYKISVLQDMGRNADTWKALEIAAKNPTIWPKSLRLLEDSMALSKQHAIGR